VDDDEGCRSLLVTRMQRLDCTVYEAASGDDALEVAEAVRPSLVILDVSLPRISGYEVCHDLREAYGDSVGIIFVSGTRAEALDRVGGLLIGADDYLAKPFDPDELVTRARILLRRATGGRRSGHANGSGDGNGDVIGHAEGTGTLTAREREVLGLLARGLDQEQIATTLVISSKTVATHIQRTLAKLGVHSRAQAVAHAHRTGLLGADFHAHVAV
jgi:DNA-binding NarL/FixJ family response regulator